MRSIHSDTNPLHQRTRTRPVYDIPTGCVCFDGRNSGPESCCTLRKMFAWWVSNTDFIYISRDRSNTQHAARSTCTHTHRQTLTDSITHTQTHRRATPITPPRFHSRLVGGFGPICEPHGPLGGGSTRQHHCDSAGRG